MHFIEFSGDQQNGDASIACLDDFAMNELNRADVDAARRLCQDKQFELQVD
jgi:hypothetical protein